MPGGAYQSRIDEDALLFRDLERSADLLSRGNTFSDSALMAFSTLDMNSKIPSINTEAVAAFANDLTKDYPRSPRETLSGYVIAARTLDKCRATLAGTAGDYHFDCPLDNFFFGFVEISAEDFKNFVATGADDEQVAKWIEEKATQRPRIEIIRWNNEWRYKRLGEMPDRIQEFMEYYIPKFVPADIRHHVDYFFDIYDAEEKRITA